jgi:hypothetical protein
MTLINDKDLIKYGFDFLDDCLTHEFVKGDICVTKKISGYYLVSIICSMPWIELPHIKYMEEIEQLYYLLHGKKIEAVK